MIKKYFKDKIKKKEENGGQKKKNIRIIRKVIDLKVATSVNW